MKHMCHYPPCKTVTPPKYFMCREHWFKLSSSLRAAVWREYMPGQEQGNAPVSQAYLDVTDEAIKYLKEKEVQGELF